jgi:hypothetical protein
LLEQGQESCAFRCIGNLIGYGRKTAVLCRDIRIDDLTRERCKRAKERRDYQKPPEHFSAL